MRHMWKSLTLTVLLIAAALLLRAKEQDTAQEKSKPPLPNFVELASGIGIGGQPTEEGLKQVAEKGYTCVVNLRSSSEQFDLAGEEKAALQLGLRYFMVPVAVRDPSEAQALAFVTLMSALKGNKVFVHCTVGARAASLMMIYLALGEGMPPDKAEEEAGKMGLRSPNLLEFARKVIAARKK